MIRIELSGRTGVYISKGNLRMNIPTFSLPSGKTCPRKTELCSKYCYARKAERSYPNVLPSRDENLRQSKMDTFVDDMKEAINKKSPEYFRIHESGDFYSQKYLEKWFNIIRGCPDTNFLAYTSNYYLDYKNRPDNLVLYYSVWPDSKNIPNDGVPRAYVIDDGSGKIQNSVNSSNKFKCSKGKDIDGCNQCLWCYKEKGDVVFEIH